MEFRLPVLVHDNVAAKMKIEELKFSKKTCFFFEKKKIMESSKNLRNPQFGKIHINFLFTCRLVPNIVKNIDVFRTDLSMVWRPCVTCFKKVFFFVWKFCKFFWSKFQQKKGFYFLGRDMGVFKISSFQNQCLRQLTANYCSEAIASCGSRTNLNGYEGGWGKGGGMGGGSKEIISCTFKII